MKNRLKILVIAAMMSLGASATYAQISVGFSISARIAPPPLPVYVQPECPVDGYLWTPGYWAYNDDDGYYWVPGVWVAPPQPNYLWTPGYWGYGGGIYGFHAGYWGPHVGFYGGVNYGYGYGGSGFYGGAWSGGHFRYNTAVVRVNTTVVHNTYVNRTVINNTTVNRTSFNGGSGIHAQPRPEERAAMNEHHVQATSMQVSHQTMASHDKSQFANVNHGVPTTTAVNRVSNRPFSQQARNTNGGMQHNTNGFGNHNAATPNPQAQQQHQNQPANNTAHSGFGNNNNRQQGQPQQQHTQPQPAQQHQQMPQQQHQQPQQQRPQPTQQRGGFGHPQGGGGGGGHRHG